MNSECDKSCFAIVVVVFEFHNGDNVVGEDCAINREFTGGQKEPTRRSALGGLPGYDSTLKSRRHLYLLSKDGELEKMRLPHKYRAALSGRYLDLAERLPSMERGLIGRLQNIRKVQRKYCFIPEGSQKITRDFDIDYAYLRLFEFFLPEDLTDLRRGLGSLFPHLNESEGERARGRNIFERAGRLQGGGWTNIGELTRDKSKFFPSSNTVEIDDLPDSVSFVQVKVHQILPSLYVLVLDFHLKEESSGILKSHIAANYLSEITFNKMLSPRGYFEIPASRVRERTVRLWRKSQRDLCESFLHQYVRGFYFRQSLTDRCLPSAEVFILKKLKSESDQTSAQIPDLTRQLSGIGIGAGTGSSYSDGEVLVSLNEETDSEKGDHHTNSVIILWDRAVKSLKTDSYATPRAAVLDDSNYLLDEVGYSLCLDAFLSKLMQNIEKLRGRILRDRDGQWTLALRFSSYFMLSRNALRIKTLLDLVHLESELKVATKGHFSSRPKSMIWVEESYQERQMTLERTLEDHVDWKIEFLSRHLEVTHGWLQEQLSLRSMLVTLWLTILVVILTVLQLFNATNIWKFLKGILGFGTEIN